LEKSSIILTWSFFYNFTKFNYSEEIYADLRAALLERVNDRETPVRVQTVIALSKLCGSEDPSEVAEGEPAVSDVLLDILAHDTSP
jgi:condensin complex subunit 3